MYGYNPYWENRARELAYLLYESLEGDGDPDVMYKKLLECGFVDDAYEWTYNDE